MKMDFDTPIPVVFDDGYMEGVPVPPPSLEGKKDLIRFLQLFEPNDHVQLCMVANDDGNPGYNRLSSQTAQEIIEELKHKDISGAFGDISEHGAWIGVNPVDGQGTRDANVTSFHRALLQSDEGDIEDQLAIIQKLKLPCDCIIHSGNRSLHAIVRIEAESLKEYRDRVDMLYQVATRAGLKVDRKHRGPSRLTRMPGVMRGKRLQYIAVEKCGMETWAEWQEYVEDLFDDLPDIERLSESYATPPAKADEIIYGILRRGHRAMLAASSGAGKSWAGNELAIAIAEGVEWLGFKVRQGRVLVVDSELDKVSLLHRFIDIYEAMGIDPANIDNIDLWCLRGSTRPMDVILPKLLRRANERNGYDMIIVDPIYSLLTGDENSASDMAKFMNCFQSLATKTNAAVLYTHHHSKGDQGQKTSQDRSSGSGVFARAPDAVLDMIELKITEERRKTLSENMQRDALISCANRLGVRYQHGDAENTMLGMQSLLMAVAPQHGKEYGIAQQTASDRAARMTGWKISGGKLREFAKPADRLVWFDYPLHIRDRWDLLADASANGEEPAWMDKQRQREKAKERIAKNHTRQVEEAIALRGEGEITLDSLSEDMGKDKATVRVWLRKSEKYSVVKGLVVKKPEAE